MKWLKKKKNNDIELLNKALREQKAQIEELKNENTDLLFTLEEYTKKENSILESIGYLEEKKREQAKSLNIKYALELERLSFFQNKWLCMVRASHDSSLQKPLAFTRETLQNCRDEIINLTRSELKMTKVDSPAEVDFEQETHRLKALPKTESVCAKINAEDFNTQNLPDFEGFATAKDMQNTAKNGAKYACYARRFGAQNSQDYRQNTAQQGGENVQNCAESCRQNTPQNNQNNPQNIAPNNLQISQNNSQNTPQNIAPNNLQNSQKNSQNNPINTPKYSQNWEQNRAESGLETPNFGCTTEENFEKEGTAATSYFATRRQQKKMSDKEIISLLEKLSV